MKINLAKSAGFCFGVKRAIDLALKTAKAKRRVCMLGDIVHNEDVVREIEKSGIRKVARLGTGKNKVLLIRAHGASVALLKKARLLGYKIVDATCPMVKEIHKIARGREKKGCRIIIIGDKKHDEVYGIIGQLKNQPIVIDDLKSIPFKEISKIKKAAVVVQSTQSLEKVNRIVRLLSSRIRDLQFFNTICRPTRIKQEEIKTMPLENEVIIVIGSKASANTRRLYEIARSLNRRSYWVHSEKDIDPGWFKDVQNVGITAGASTPDWITQKVVKRISELNLPGKPSTTLN
jgi:4-hydroxy-3-methylbut-2-enyl diphosphate reductase